MSCKFSQITHAMANACLDFDVLNSNDVDVCGACCDSRAVEPGNIFICKGKNFKPEFLRSALEKGAVAVVCASGMGLDIPSSVPCVVASDIRRAQAVASKVAWDFPDEKLAIVGITGTKGKTTTASFVKSAIEKCCGQQCGFVGTHHVFNGKDTIEPPNTTPEPPFLYCYLHEMVENGLKHCVMEISSQGLKYDRVWGLSVDVAALINVGIDHIAPIEHPSVEDYVASKFKIAGLSENLVVNKNLALLPEVERFVNEGICELQGNEDINLVTFSGDDFDGKLKMCGSYNKENAACALKICKLLGLDEQTSIEAISEVAVEGRMEVSTSKDGRLVGIVDYAHTKDSYLKFFEAVKEMYPGAFVITYFGCSSGKALRRQTELPEAAAANSDFVVVTSDEPFAEDPAEFAQKIVANLPSGTAHGVISNRDDACDFAFKKAEEVLKSDMNCECVVCALGKGSEDTCPCSTGDIAIIPDTKHVPQKIKEHDEQTC